MDGEGKTETADAATATAVDRLPLALTMGFTGHRTVADKAATQASMDGALAAIEAAFAQLAASEFAGAFEGQPRLRLFVGQAPGTDRLMIERWRERGLGEVHNIYPFRDPASGHPLTDRPGGPDPETDIEPRPESEPWTGIDALGLGLRQDQAHAEVSRWIVRHADFLVGWWDGEPGRGAGGTADTMRRALERGLPVIWLKPGHPAARLIDPDRAHRHADVFEAMVHVETIAQPLTAEALADLLRPVLTPPGDPGAEPRDGEVVGREDYAATDPLALQPQPLGTLQQILDRTLWRSYRMFETLMGRAPPTPSEAGEPPDAIVGQPGFQRLEAAGDEAGRRASHLGDIHRSEQLLLILIGTAAVFVGAWPALGGDASHPWAAGLELVLAISAWSIATRARRAHRHRRWSDARRLAERLRAATATWPMGFDVADGRPGPAHTWTEWRARAVLRAAGPRRGWIDAASFSDTRRWVVARLLDSQFAYHRRQHRLARTIEHSLHFIEIMAGLTLLSVLAAYLVTTGFHLSIALVDPQQFVGFVTVVSAVAPAVASGCLALEATNGFGEVAGKSAHLQSAFEELQHELGETEGLAYHHVQTIVRQGATLLVEDVDAWRDRLLRRRIVQGA